MRYHWRRGKESGFRTCCILWFLFRDVWCGDKRRVWLQRNTLFYSEDGIVPASKYYVHMGSPIFNYIWELTSDMYWGYIPCPCCKVRPHRRVKVIYQ